ncbi:MAG: energy-coupling factor transporter transmembrane protein EcfT [Clostridia bacterium]|nr:energy-coupling factor transporter transmembrane protein EcfT [Clostridia bacterium]
MHDVTWGQYYPVDSFVHRSDPRVKLLFLIAYIVALFVAKNFYGLLLCFIILLMMIFAARVPLGSVIRSVRAVIIILIITAAINLLFHGGDHVWYESGVISITREGLIFSLFLLFRIVFLVMGAAVLTLTTTPVALADGMESLMKPLKYIKFPVHEFALIMSIALKFIPTLLDETHRIISAQKARGADFESGNIFKRIKAVIPILIPLLISAFRRAEELGDAMDARCYSNTKNRTKYKKLTLTYRDLIITIVFAVMIAGVVLLNVYGANIIPSIAEFVAVR